MLKYNILNKTEEIILTLRSFYEKFSYQRITTSEFEEYDFLISNKKFLSNTKLISFMNEQGKLIALKPDTTLSIAKNVVLENDSKKVYYEENVFRYIKESSNYKSYKQMGVEFFTLNNSYSNLEIITIALETLNLLNNDFILNLSHSIFINGILNEFKFSKNSYKQIINNIKNKNIHDLEKILKSEELTDKDIKRITTICTLSGEFNLIISKAKEISTNKDSLDAIQELEKVYYNLSKIVDSNFLSKIKLDLSMFQDLDYYNGLIFKGYIRNLPKEILIGGRYDNLMSKLNKKTNAIGFVVNLDELYNYYLDNNQKTDCDYLILYDDSTSELDLVKTSLELIKNNYKVISKHINNKTVITFSKDSIDFTSNKEIK